MNIENWYNEIFEKPQYNWYGNNNTYFDDIKYWKKNKEIVLVLFYV